MMTSGQSVRQLVCWYFSDVFSSYVCFPDVYETALCCFACSSWRNASTVRRPSSVTGLIHFPVRVFSSYVCFPDVYETALCCFACSSWRNASTVRRPSSVTGLIHFPVRVYHSSNYVCFPDVYETALCCFACSSWRNASTVRRPSSVTGLIHFPVRVYHSSNMRRISSSVYTKEKTARNGRCNTIPAIHVAGTLMRKRQLISSTVPKYCTKDRLSSGAEAGIHNIITCPDCSGGKVD